MPEKFILSSADIAIFSLLLVGSSSAGLYFLVFEKKLKSNDEYLLGGKDMSIFPISFSLMATFMSATTLLGIPTEMYLFGTNMTFMNLGFILGPIIASILFIPIYFDIGVKTSYEYLERRFGTSTRRILCIIYLLKNVLFNGAVLYAPALALSAVTNLSIWVSVISIGAVCTFYCTLGGMKAVVWTDVFQSILMYTCLIAIIIKGCIDLGGIEYIFKRAYDGGRIFLPTFKLDFSIRYTMWSIFLQGAIITAASYGAFQTQVQRQISLKNFKRSVISSLLSIPMIVSFQLLCCLCGIIFYVYFQNCDPMTSPEHPITSYDQLMPYYIISTMREYPGLPGLCIAGIFSATLSSISSEVNSMAAVTYQDIIKPIWKDLKEDVLVTKIASIFYGALSIFFAFLVASMGHLVKISIVIVGMLSGPALAVFLLASLTTTTNEMGVNIGVISSFLLAICVTFIPNKRYYPPLPLQSNCSKEFTKIANVSVDTVHLHVNSSDFSVKDISVPDLPDNFPVSYMWISPLSLLACLIVGYLASWIISCVRGKSEPVPPELLSPIRRRFCSKDFTIKHNSKDQSVGSKSTKNTDLQKNRLQTVFPLKNFDR